MALQFSTTLRDNQANQIESTIGTSPTMKLFTGSPPANCGTADSGSLLITITLPSDWLTAASGNGQVSKNGTWSGTASGTGTAGYFRIYSSGGTCHMQGTVSTSSADLNLDYTGIATGQTVTISSATITAGNA